MTDLDPKHREFFEKLKALCAEYDVEMAGCEYDDGCIEFDFSHGMAFYYEQQFDKTSTYVSLSHGNDRMEEFKL